MTANSLDGFISSLLVNFVIFLVVVCLYFRYRNRNDEIYRPLDVNEDGTETTLDGVSSRHIIRESITDEVVLANNGLDGLMLVLFLRVVLKTVTVATVLSWIILPLNILGDGSEEGMNVLTANNIVAGSNVFVAHSAVILIWSVCALYFCYSCCSQFVQLRHDHLTRPNIPENSAFLLRFASEPDSPIEQQGMLTYWDTQALAVLNADLLKMENELEACRAVVQDGKDRPTHKPKMCSCEKVDSIEFYESAIEEKKAEIGAKKTEELVKEKLIGAGIVPTTKLTSGATWLELVTALPDRVAVSRAPQAADMAWGMLPGPPSFGKDIGASLAVVAFIVAFIPVTALIGALTNLTGIDEKCSCLGWLLENEGLAGFLQTWIPVILTIVFLMLVPPVLYKLAGIRKPSSLSGLTDIVTSSFTWFLHMHVYFALVFYSSFPGDGDLATSVANAVTNASGFFVVWVMTKAIVGWPLAQSRLIPLIVCSIKRRFLVRCPREYKEAAASSPIDFGLQSANLLIVLTISLTYCTLAPIIMPFAILFFVFASYVIQHLFLHINKAKYDGGGLIFVSLVRLLISGMMVAQISNALFFAAKSSWIAFGICCASAVLTFVGWCRMSSRFDLPGAQAWFYDSQIFHDLDVGAAGNSASVAACTLEETAVAYQDPALASTETAKDSAITAMLEDGVQVVQSPLVELENPSSKGNTPSSSKSQYSVSAPPKPPPRPATRSAFSPTNPPPAPPGSSRKDPAVVNV